MKDQAIDTLIHYEKPIHLHKSLSFLNFKAGSFPNAEAVCDKELSLPIYPGLTKESVEYVCKKVKSFFATN